MEDEFYRKGIILNPPVHKPHDRERLTAKCCNIIDEINVLKALDESELRNDLVVINYLRVMEMIRLMLFLCLRFSKTFPV
ncbi:MAG: hypothetical protein E6600_11075 [Anaerocolumna aminovalerica]|uniref:hypothetical protein n=1 Tax=Anaerocolumna aminovalerica TaxID=1527 RepID=UPI000BE3EFED|nr:hypothetical protein [Anaerocolumna aminovalerica]MDU6265030.1 hypothetical protein [Anaerocolumna aminovalerica]